MAVKTQLNAVLNKKMDRQGFLKHVAVGIVAVSGATTALRFLAPGKQHPVSVAGYGSSAYGGDKPKVG